MLGTNNNAGEIAQINNDHVIAYGMEQGWPHGDMDQGDEAGAQRSDSKEKILERWAAQGSQAIALMGMSPEQCAIDNSIRTCIGNEKNQRFLYDFGTDLQNMDEDSLRERFPKNYYYAVNLKRAFEEGKLQPPGPSALGSESAQGSESAFRSEDGQNENAAVGRANANDRDQDDEWEDGDVSAQGSESAVGSDDEVGDGRQPTMPYTKGE